MAPGYKRGRRSTRLVIPSCPLDELSKTPRRDWLDTTHLSNDAGGASVRGGVWAGLSQASEFTIQLGTLFVLARLLNPSDYGLLGMAMVFVGIPALLTGGGLNAATIQQKQLTSEQVSNLFWINGGLGLALSLCVCALGPVSALFFRKSELVWLVPALAVPLVFAGVSLQHRALLRRQMLFRRTALVEIGAQICGAVVAIGSALLGAEYWALALRQIAIGVTQSVALWFACDFRPRRYDRSVPIGKLLRFGGALTLSSFLLYLARRVDNLVIGKVFGDGALGLYEQAYRLLRAPVQQIRAPLQSVSLPAMSVLQDRHADFARYYYRFIELIAMVSMPLVVVAVVFADDLVLFVLGPKWAEVATIFRWFAALSFIEPVSTTRGLVMVAHGLARRQLALQASFALSSTVAVIIGAQWSVNGVALALVVAHYVGLVPSLVFCFRDTAVTPTGFFTALVRPFAGSLIVAVVGLSLLYVLPEGTLRLLLGTIACLGAYALAYWFVPSMRARAVELGSIIVKKLHPKKKVASGASPGPR